MIWVVAALVAGTVAITLGILYANLRYKTFEPQWIQDRYDDYKAVQIKKERLDPLLGQAYKHDEMIEALIQTVDPNWRLGMSRDHVCLHHEIAHDVWSVHLKGN